MQRWSELTKRLLGYQAVRKSNVCRLCGSWLACDAGTAVYQGDRGDAIAGKPAPTQASVLQDIRLRAR
ncbi:hypothetical protein FIV37_02720 [Pseudomonas gessardii]|nr:hypothetical protein [Pseudomonas gessardii]